MQEIWKDINGYDGVYQVSNTGLVRSADHMDFKNRNRIKGRILKQGKKENGYMQVSLTDKNGKAKNYYVHRLVVNAFTKCGDEYEVNHIDENKQNNTLENLECVQHKENVSYGTRLERIAKKHRKAVMQFDLDGKFINEFCSTVEAEKMTGVFHNNISAVCKRKVRTAGGFVWRYKEENGQENCY